MDSLYEIVKETKKEIEGQIKTIEVEIWKEKNNYIITLYHDKCVSGYYYFEDFYAKEKSPKMIADEILKEYNEYQIESSMKFMEEEIEKFKDINYAKDKIYCRMEKEDIIDEVKLPYIKIDNSVVIFYIKAKDFHDKTITMAITSELMEDLRWSLNANDLLMFAMNNISQKDPFKINKVENSDSLLSIGRKSKHDVTTLLLFPDLLSEACRRLESDVVTVFFPDDTQAYVFKGTHNYEGLRKILEILNESSNKEIQTGKVYVYPF